MSVEIQLFSSDGQTTAFHERTCPRIVRGLAGGLAERLPYWTLGLCALAAEAIEVAVGRSAFQTALNGGTTWTETKQNRERCEER